MAVSVFELFKIGIGPSSSHTVGPMRAAQAFVARLAAEERLEQVNTVQATLYGSLAHTGRGHGTDTAVLLGLEGALPDRIDPDTIAPRLAAIDESGRIRLLEQHTIPFARKEHLVFNKRENLPHHPDRLAWQTSIDCRLQSRALPA